MDHVDVPQEFLAIIKQREGFRGLPYRDTKGIATIGYGHNLSEPISEAAATAIQIDDAESIAHQVAGVIGDDVWPTLAPARAWALADARATLAKLAKFVHMIAAVRSGDWAEAAAQALRSEWATDVGPGRANEVTAMLRSGAWPT